MNKELLDETQINARDFEAYGDAPLGESSSSDKTERLVPR